MSKPIGYMTADEFTSLAIDICRDIGYFKEDDECHPGDLEVNLSVVMQAIAGTATFIMQRQRMQEVYGHRHDNGVE